MKTVSQISVISLFLVTTALSAADFSSAFLQVPSTARESALASTLTAAASGIEAVHNNPALLGDLDGHQPGTRPCRVGFTGSQLYDERYLSTFSWSQPLTRGGFGFDLMYIDLGNVERTTLTRGLTNLADGTASANDFYLHFGYGAQVLKNVSLGAGLKFFTEKLDNEQASNVGLDVGVLYQTPIENLRLAATLKNIGRRTHYEDISEKMPAVLDVGAAYTFLNNSMTVTGDIVKNRREDFAVQLGFEAKLMEKFALRFGFDSDNEAKENVSAGFGIEIDGWAPGTAGFTVDYAITPGDDFDAEHFVTLGYSFEPKKRVKPEDTIEYYLYRAKKRIVRGWYSWALQDIIRVMEHDPQNSEALSLSIRLRKAVKILKRR